MAKTDVSFFYKTDGSFFVGDGQEGVKKSGNIKLSCSSSVPDCQSNLASHMAKGWTAAS